MRALTVEELNFVSGGIWSDDWDREVEVIEVWGIRVSDTFDADGLNRMEEFDGRGGGSGGVYYNAEGTEDICKAIFAIAGGLVGAAAGGADGLMAGAVLGAGAGALGGLFVAGPAGAAVGTGVGVVVGTVAGTYYGVTVGAIAGGLIGTGVGTLVCNDIS
jgi:hypothetical protein